MRKNLGFRFAPPQVMDTAPSMRKNLGFRFAPPQVMDTAPILALFCVIDLEQKWYNGNGKDLPGMNKGGRNVGTVDICDHYDVQASCGYS